MNIKKQPYSKGATVKQKTKSVTNQIDLLHRIKGKNIGQIHYFLRGTDGVSLQAQETEKFLLSVGVNTYNLGADLVDNPLTSLDYHSDHVVSLRDKMFDPAVVLMNDSERKISEQILIEEIIAGSQTIYKGINNFIETFNLDIVHVRNLLSMPFLHVEAALALDRVIRDKKDVRFILHHHDFYWEGPESIKYITHYPNIRKMAESLTAPNYPNTKHICINSLSQQIIFERKDLVAHCIPDGFDFDQPIELMTTQQESIFKRRYGILNDDLVFALTTRVRSNKGFQTAIQIIKTLQHHKNRLINQQNGVGYKRKKFGTNNKIVLLVLQSADFDDEYFKSISEFAEKEGVCLIYVGDAVVADAQYSLQDAKDGKYSFYSLTKSNIIDVVLYVATHEGFGNQAIEAAWAKRLLVMFGYPVAVSDIFSHIEGIIKMGNINDTESWGVKWLPIVKQNIVDTTVDELIETLLDHEKEIQMIEKSYNSFRALCHIHTIGLKYIKVYLEE